MCRKELPPAGLPRTFFEVLILFLGPGPSILAGHYRLGILLLLALERKVVVALGIEGRIEVDQVNGGGGEMNCHLTRPDHPWRILPDGILPLTLSATPASCGRSPGYFLSAFGRYGLCPGITTIGSVGGGFRFCFICLPGRYVHYCFCQRSHGPGAACGTGSLWSADAPPVLIEIAARLVIAGGQAAAAALATREEDVVSGFPDAKRLGVGSNFINPEGHHAAADALVKALDHGSGLGPDIQGEVLVERSGSKRSITAV